MTRSTRVCKMLTCVAISFRSCVLMSVFHVCIDFLHILTFPCLLFCFVVYFLEILEGAFLWTGSRCSLCLYHSICMFQYFLSSWCVWWNGAVETCEQVCSHCSPGLRYVSLNSSNHLLVTVLETTWFFSTCFLYFYASFHRRLHKVM